MQNTIFKHNLLTCTDKYTSATRDPLPHVSPSALLSVFTKLEIVCNFYYFYKN